MLEAQLDKAIKVCDEAGPTDFEDLNQPPQLTYAGATGWSRAAMEQTVFVLRWWIDRFDDDSKPF